MATWDDACAILRELPGVEIAAPGGERVARVRGARLAFIAANDRSRPDGFGTGELLTDGWRLLAPKRLVRQLDEA